MINGYHQLFFLVIQTILLYFISRLTINELFYFLRFFLKNEKIVFSLVSLFFLPGTITHEMAHYFAALILMLQVKEVKIFPEWEKNYIKLGKVLYEKKDLVRSIIVGIAPVLAGFLFFWWMSVFKIFPSQNIILNLFFGYIVFAVSSTMFSSKQDLIDLIYILPLSIIIIGIVYIFDIRFDFILKNEISIKFLLSSIKSINFYLLLSLTINLFLIILFKSFRFMIKR